MAKKGKELTLEEKLEQALVPAEEQPYEVPENWCWTTLGRIADIQSGGTPSSSKSEYYDNGDIPWITPADLSDYNNVYIARGKRNITTLGLEKSSARILPKDTVMLSSRAPIGYVVIAGNDICTNQGFKNFLPSSCYLPRYLYWYLKDNKAFLEQYASGTTFLELSASRAKDIVFPFAPLAEQQRIVDRIESLFTKLDEAKEKIQNVLDESENRKNAILHKAFTGELTKKWREENRINKEDTWESVALKDCGVWGGGGTPNTNKDEYWNNGDIMWITSKDMKSDIIEDTQLHVNMEGINNSAARYCEEPSVLFVMRSGILRRILPVSMVKKGFCVNQDLKFLTPHNIEVEYLFWVCKAFEKDILQTCKKDGTTVESIEASRLLSYEIPLPSKEERKKIIAMAQAFSEYENNIKKIAENVLYGIENVKKSILAKSFRGELGTNDSSDEDAIELLKSVLEVNL